MTMPEHEYAEAQRKKREDEIWNSAIEEAAVRVTTGWIHTISGRVSAIRALKRSTE